MASQKRYPNTAARSKTIAGVGAANRIGTRTPLVPTFGAHVTSAITITFNQPVVLKGLPNYSNGTITLTAATRPTPTTVVLTFNNTLAATVPLTIPFEDPSIRNMSGGYVQSGAYTFS